MAYNKIAVVGTPCQIKAVDLLVKEGALKFERIVKIGIACSGGTSYLATSEYKRKQNKTGAIFYYRGDGWPGKNCLIYDNEKFEYKHTDSLFEKMFSSQIFKNPGCHFCCDQFAEDADISCCDFWDREELKTEKEGNSCVICRNQTSVEFITQMKNAGVIDVVKPLNEQEVIDGQKQILNEKKGHVRKTIKYKVFIRGVNFVFKSRAYRFFNKRVYNKIAYI